MNSDSGFGSGGSPYEYTVAEAKSKTLTLKKIGLIEVYILWAAVFFIVGASTRLFIYLIALIPISLWIIVWLTWKLTQVEYEYSYFTGALTVSRILGNRTRKKLLHVRIQELSAIFPYGEANASRIEAYGAENDIFAASSQNAENSYVALWQDNESGKRCVLFFEPNEKRTTVAVYVFLVIMFASFA
jgi:hypothetical protein